MHFSDFSGLWRTAEVPLVAILRGVTPQEAPDIGKMLLAAGFRWIEVPLNSPQALDSIALLRELCGERAWVGAGTVLTARDVDAVADAGGQLIISPNMNDAVIRRSRERELISMPGVITPSEAFAAIDAGASALKLFPAEMGSPVMLKAMRAVLPQTLTCLPVGGIQPDAQQMRSWRDAGAQGFGLGGGLYRAGDKAETVSQRALAYRRAWQESGA